MALALVGTTLMASPMVALALVAPHSWHQWPLPSRHHTRGSALVVMVALTLTTFVAPPFCAPFGACPRGATFGSSLLVALALVVAAVLSNADVGNAIM